MFNLGNFHSHHFMDLNIEIKMAYFMVIVGVDVGGGGGPDVNIVLLTRRQQIQLTPVGLSQSSI